MADENGAPEYVDRAEARAASMGRVEAAASDWALARDVYQKVLDAKRAVLDAHETQERARAQAQAENAAFARDPHVYADGVDAGHQVDAAKAVWVQARRSFEDALTAAVRDGYWEIGDPFPSPCAPLGVDLVVAEVFRPEQIELGEVTATSDGKPIVRDQHPWDIDPEEGKPIFDVERADWVRYERWWQGGPRSLGWVHPATRKVVDVDG